MKLIHIVTGIFFIFIVVWYPILWIYHIVYPVDLSLAISNSTAMNILISLTQFLNFICVTINYSWDSFWCSSCPKYDQIMSF